MFFLTLALGALFLVIIHHLTRRRLVGRHAPFLRTYRRRCCFRGWRFCLFPSLLLAQKIYPWMTLNPATTALLSAKWPVFTMPGFCVASAIFFGIWWLLTARINYWSLRQDVTGEALCTRKMRFHSGWGILAFAATVTFAPMLWMQVAAIPVVFDDLWPVYVCHLRLDRAGDGLHHHDDFATPAHPDRVLHDNQFYYLGVLFFAFTLLQAYFEFAQYFVIWNGNVPDETFWYLIRENGSWWCVSMILIFGHFFAAVHPAAARAA